VAKTAGIGQSCNNFAKEWASWMAPMEMMDRPELAGLGGW
jgi:hypothetical protein